MRLAFACPYYGPTYPMVGHGQRANFGNAAEGGHVWVEDVSSNGVQHREACESMLERAAKLDIDYLFWTEHDCVLPPDAVTKLVLAMEATPEADIMTGIVFRRSRPYTPIVSVQQPVTREQYDRMRSSPKVPFHELAMDVSFEGMQEMLYNSIQRVCVTDRPFPVDGAGMNCFLMRKAAVDKMVGTPNLFAADKWTSIDFVFFRHCRRAGLKLYCAPNVLCGHLSDPKVVTVKDWEGCVEDALASAEAMGVFKEVLTATHPGGGWCDKERYWGLYGPLFGEMRDSATKVAEIGVWVGNSLRLWRDMFPKAHVYGIDIEEKREHDEERITTFVADQEKRDELRRFTKTYGSDFDLIVDDGGHTMIGQQVSLGVLFPHVRPGGFYVVEDVHTSNMYPGWKVEPDRENTTLRMIDRWNKLGRIKTKYMTPEEAQYVADHIEWATLYKGEGPLSLTWVIKKKRVA